MRRTLRHPVIAVGLLGLAGLWMCAGEARAQQVSVHILPGLEAPASEPELRAGLARSAQEAGFRLVDGIRLARQGHERELLAPPRPELRVQARTLKEEGWRAYLEARATFAADRLSEARGLALELGFTSSGRELVGELSLLLGVVKLDLGRPTEAADEFRLAQRLRPTGVVDDSRFKPEVVEAYQNAISQEREKHPVRVTVSPGSARLWVNGEARDGANLSLEDGLHMVAASELGHRAGARLVSVAPGGADDLGITLEVDVPARDVLSARELLVQGQSQARMHELVEALGSYAGDVDFVFLSSVWRRQAPALLFQRCAGVPLRCSSVRELGYPEGGLRSALDAVARDLLGLSLRELSPSLQVDPRLVNGEGRPRIEGGKETPLWKEPWLWVGVSTLAVVGGALWLYAGEDEIVPSFGGDTCDFGGCQ